MIQPLEFELPIYELEQRILEDPTADQVELEKQLATSIEQIYGNLTTWQRVQLSRHPNRPHAKEIIHALMPDFHELHGDRCFSDDAAIIGGIGHLQMPEASSPRAVMAIGIEKGSNTKEKIHHNFGMPLPDGYRKALRLMQLAHQFNIPIITFIDTPGAYPGLTAEERGQGQAIANNLANMFDLKVPIIAVVIGEGGSGGALALGIADKVFMMQYSVYSVISPESCASILWSDASKAQTAAQALQLYPEKALELGVIDAIINEPIGGAHRNPTDFFRTLKDYLGIELKRLLQLESRVLLSRRFDKFRAMGNHTIK